MLTKLIDLLLEAKEYLKPWASVRPWEMGVIIRRGNFHQIREPGYYWKIPVWDKLVRVIVVVTTIKLPPQSIGEYMVRGIVKYRITDPKPYVCDIMGDREILRDIAMRQTQRWLTRTGEINTTMIEKIHRSVKEDVKKYGFDVQAFDLIEYGKIRSYRLIMDTGEEE